MKILGRLKLDRPIYLKTKQSLIMNDKEPYKDPAHSINKFNAFKRAVEE